MILPINNFLASKAFASSALDLSVHSAIGPVNVKERPIPPDSHHRQMMIAVTISATSPTAKGTDGGLTLKKDDPLPKKYYKNRHASCELVYSLASPDHPFTNNNLVSSHIYDFSCSHYLASDNRYIHLSVLVNDVEL